MYYMDKQINTYNYLFGKKKLIIVPRVCSSIMICVSLMCTHEIK